MRVTAPAKLNLFLEVTGKRPNGYHELYSLCCFLTLADELEITPAPANACNSDISDNIIITAAGKIGVTADIKLTKNIPMGGGLGGGSADAAAVLATLGQDIAPEKLYEIALSLGADVPVCLYSQLNKASAAFFSGIGEIVKPASALPEFYVILLNPNKHLATPDVFRKLLPDGGRWEPSAKFSWDSDEDFFRKLKKRRNDLEDTAISLMPDIAHVLSVLQSSPGCIMARMTGSGATCFGLYRDRALAEEAEQDIRAEYAEWFVKMAKPI